MCSEQSDKRKHYIPEKEACQGSAGAGHAFSKAGIDDGEHGGLAGPELLVNQLRTWLPLWLDGRRANAKQLAEQEDWGELLPRPSLEEVDDVCKTYKSTAGLGHDCINTKAILQLPVELRVRFIDLLMAFHAKLVKPLCWAHMMVLRPKPSGGHRTIGLTVAPLRVLSRLRRPLAQKWENERDATHFWGCQGKACDRAAWAAAKGRQQSAASLPLDLAKFYEHVGHDHLWGEGRKTSFPRRLLAWWCASYEGWRFLEADKRATFSFWAFGTILPGRSGATTAAKLMLALLEIVSSRLPTYRRWNVVNDISGHVAGSPRMVQVLTAEAARLLVEGLQARHLPLSKGKSNILVDGTDNLKQDLSRQLDLLGIDECDTARNVGADLQLGRRRQALVAGEGSEAHETSQAAAEGRRTNSQSDSHWLECWDALGFRGSGLHSNTAPSHQSRRGQSHLSAQPRTERSHNDDGPRPSKRGQRTSTRGSDITDKWCWLGMERHARPRHNAGGQARPPQAAVVRRHRRGGHFRAHALAAGLERAVGEAPHHHDGTKIDLLAVAPKTVGFWVNQASLLWSDSSAHWNHSKGPHFWEAIRPPLVFQVGGWSLWHRNVLVRLVSLGIWTQERFARLRREDGDSCQLCNEGPGTVVHRCYECPALQTERDMQVSQEVRQRRFPWGHTTGNSLHTAFSPAPLPFCQQVLSSGHALFCGPQTGSWRGTSSRTDLRRAVALCGEQAGQWWRSTMWGTSAAAFGAVPCDVLPGQTSLDGEEYAAPMAGHAKVATINGSKCKALGAQGSRAHVWSRLLVSHDEVRAVKVKGHATQRDVEAGRTSHLFKRGNDYADIFAKKGPTHTRLLFESPRQSLPVLL